MSDAMANRIERANGTIEMESGEIVGLRSRKRFRGYSFRLSEEVRRHWNWLRKH